MKYAILILCLLAGCTGRPDAPSAEPPYDFVKCKGEFQEVTRYKISVRCDDGKIVEYTTYKYSFNRKEAQ